MEQQTYWRPADSTPVHLPERERDTLDALQAKLDHAVALTLRSDVPVGLFLSGGVDSALVAESAARQGHLAAAFCVDYEETPFSESTRAQHVADRVVFMDDGVIVEDHCMNAVAAETEGGWRDESAAP